MKRLDEVRQRIKEAIDTAGQAAAAVSDPVEFSSAFRRLLVLLKEQYPIYIYARYGVDLQRGSTPINYPAEQISAECEALLDFCESERLIHLVRRFDPALAEGEYPFFSFLNRTLWMDGQKIQKKYEMQDKYAGMTGLTEYRQKEKEDQIFYHIAKILKTKAQVTPADYQRIAAAVNCKPELVVDVLCREWSVGASVQLDAFFDKEDEVRMHDLIADPQTLPDEAGDECLLTKAYLLLKPTLTEKEQSAARLGFTKALIDDRLRRLITHLQKQNRAINSIPTLFAYEEAYVLQQLTVLKAEFEGHPMIEPRLITLVAKEKQSPTFARLGAVMGRSEEAFRKSYNNVKKKLERQLLG